MWWGLMLQRNASPSSSPPRRTEGRARSWGYESFELPHMFQLIIIPYCTLIYAINDQERRAVFERCFQHLHPGGVLVSISLRARSRWGKSALPCLAGRAPFTGEVLVHTVQVKGIREDLRLLNQVSYHMGEDGPAKITVQASLKGFAPVSGWQSSSLRWAFPCGGSTAITAVLPTPEKNSV